jgi:nucleoside-diphosphate-sugar epimerase
MLFRVAALGVRPRLTVDGSISTVHVADLVEGILLVATREAAIGRTYFIAGDEHASLDELVENIHLAVGRTGVAVPVPAPLLRGAGRVAEVARDVAGVSIVFDRWKAEEILTGYWACSNERARRELGFQPSVSLPEGLRSTARWYRDNGWL